MAGLFSLIIVSCISSQNYKEAATVQTSSTPAAAASAPASPAVTAPAPKAKQNWQYTTTVDKMSGKEAKFAKTTSTNSLRLDFPYSGTNHGHLTIRQHPKYGTDVIFEIDKGQLICNSYDGCYVSIRFDDKPAMRIKAFEPSDHSSDTLFLQSESKLIKELLTAKTVHVQATFFQAGDQILTFSTSGLKWEQSKPKK